MIKRPICSSPTPVITALRNPRRDVPQAIFVGDPPMYLLNDPISSRRPPICAPYKSTDDRPIVIKSNKGIKRRSISPEFLFLQIALLLRPLPAHLYRRT